LSDAFGNALGNSIVAKLGSKSTAQNEKQANDRGDAAYERARAQGKSPREAELIATREVLATLPSGTRSQININESDDVLGVSYLRGDKSKGGLTLTNANAGTSHREVVSWISDEGLWGNNDALNLAMRSLDKRAAVYSHDNIQKLGQQAFAEGEHRGVISASRVGSRTYDIDLLKKPNPQLPNVPRSPSKMHNWLSGSEGIRAELYGVGTLPASVAAVTGAIWNVPNGSFINSFQAGSKVVSGENLLNGSRYVFDAKSGMLDVTTTSAMSSRLQMASGALAAVKVAPFLSLAGTTLEYSAFAFVGDSQLSMTKGKATLSDFAVDASLDFSKSVVAAAVGGGVGAAVSSAWAGAAIGSAFPGVGTVFGFAAGFAIGAGTAWAIEKGYDFSDSRDSFKRWLKE